MAKEGGAKGTMGGGRGPMGAANAVDADKLWIDRINTELQQQRAWHQEYGFMVSAEGGGVTTDGSGKTRAAGTLAGQAAAMSVAELEELKKSLQGATLKSNSQASYVSRKPVELFNAKRNNRQKFRDT